MIVYSRYIIVAILGLLFNANLQGSLNTLKLPDVEVMMPMRDGKLLPTSIYFPLSNDRQKKNSAENKAKPPCVLIRQPLGKAHVDPTWLALLNDGYMVAVQSTRSSCDPSGKTLPYFSDAWGELSDGYDTVEWLGSCEWTNGKVATLGQSATGITQLLLAPTAPSHLVCQYIEVAAPSLYHYAVWPGGQYRKEQVDGWLKVHNSDASVAYELRHQPVYDAFWKRFNALEVAENIKVAQIHVGGWYDIFSQGTIDAFCSAQENSLHGKENKLESKLIMGPWVHGWKRGQAYGDFETYAAGLPPQHVTFKDWLDYHVKNERNSVESAPPVQYYVMGPFDGSTSRGNKWKAARKWPPDAAYVQMYLTQDSQGHHTLKEQNMQAEEALCNVLFDSQNPVPTLGGRNLFIASGPKDLRSIEARKDVVTFTSDELPSDTEVTGRIAACLYASKVLCDRDICLRLADVYPDGKSILIAEGVSHVHPEDVKGIQTSPQPIIVDLWSTSMVFAKGHKIRLTISGSNYPAYETSLAANPLASNPLASNPTSNELNDQNICFAVHSGGKHASYLALPVINDAG